MSKVYFEDGSSLEAPKNPLKRAIKWTVKNWPQRYFFRMPDNYNEIVEAYWNVHDSNHKLCW